MANLITISTPQSPSLRLATNSNLTLINTEWGKIAGDIEDQTDLQAYLTSINSTITNSVNSINEAISLLQQAIELKQSLIDKGVANGYAPLDSNNKIPIQFIPLSQGISFFIDYSNFPPIGEVNTLYIDKTTLSLYLWDGIQYSKLSENNLSSLNFSNSINSQYFSLIF